MRVRFPPPAPSFLNSNKAFLAPSTSAELWLLHLDRRTDPGEAEIESAFAQTFQTCFNLFRQMALRQPFRLSELPNTCAEGSRWNLGLTDAQFRHKCLTLSEELEILK